VTSLQGLFAREGVQLLRVVQDVIRAEVKQGDDFARTLAVKPSHLSMALNGNGRNFDLRWLPAVLHVDQRHRVLEHQAALVGRTTIEREQITPEQWKDRVEAALRRAGRAGDAILRDALAEEEP